MSKIDSTKLPYYLGHRERLKNKFLNGNHNIFYDYELIELILFSIIPRKDVKPLAKELINNFGDLHTLISAEKHRILNIKGTNENLFLNLQIIGEIINRILYKKIIKKNVISSWIDLIDYLKFKMGGLKIEQFRVLFLNKKNVLIADEIMSNGTIDQTMVYPREIVKKSLYHEAGAIILVHNHPSGDIKPSAADIDLTTYIANICKGINISLHDHVIIGRDNYYSFKSNMLL